MLNILLAAYLLIVFPALNLWRSLRPKRDKPPRALLRRYWSMSWHALVLLGLLWAGSRQAGTSLHDLGFDYPLSRRGAWGLAFALLLLGVLWAASSIIEGRKSPELRAQNEATLLDSRFPWPGNAGEAIVFAVATTLMTAGWEILYRGFVLLLLTPVTGMPAAIATAAIAYGAGHGYTNPKQLIGSIVSAFVFTIAYAMTHSLWWLMVIHAGLPLTALPLVLRAQRRRQDASAAESSSLVAP